MTTTETRSARRGKDAEPKSATEASTKPNGPQRNMGSTSTPAHSAKGSISQSYRVSFANPRAPSFVFDADVYTFAWVKQFADGLASAARKDFEAPSDEASEARRRGERMGHTLKFYANNWGIPESDLRAIRIEWRMLDGSMKSVYYEHLEHGGCRKRIS